MSQLLGLHYNPQKHVVFRSSSSSSEVGQVRQKFVKSSSEARQVCQKFVRFVRSSSEVHQKFVRSSSSSSEVRQVRQKFVRFVRSLSSSSEAWVAVLLGVKTTYFSFFDGQNSLFFWILVGKTTYFVVKK